MKYFVALSALLLASCSSFEFKTNLDPSNFTEYFKPSSVDEVTEEDLVTKPYRTVKTVEGLSCQEDEKDAVATEVFLTEIVGVAPEGLLIIVVVALLPTRTAPVLVPNLKSLSALPIVTVKEPA